MHAAARSFVERWIRPDDDPVIEIGSRNVNGGLRDLFPRAPEFQTYVGIDVQDGPGVDIVADAAQWTPPEPAACVICCEVLEHWKLDAELVTLSACETALGKSGGGDGLLQLGHENAR